MLAKAAQIAAEAPELWRRSAKFIEAGDWLVWRLTGREVRSFDFAAYKVQYSAQAGYPKHVVEGLPAKLTDPRLSGAPCWSWGANDLLSAHNRSMPRSLAKLRPSL